MAVKTLSKYDAIHFGWQKSKDNIGFFIVLLLIAASISIFPEIIGGVLKTYKSLIPVLLPNIENSPNWIQSVISFLPIIINIISIGGTILFLVVQMGLIKISLKFTDNSKSKFRDLFSCFPLIIKYFMGAALYAAIVFGILALPVVPGYLWKESLLLYSFQLDPMLKLLIISGFGVLIMVPITILGVRFQFFSYFIVDKGYGPIKALKNSAKITKGHVKNLFLLVFILQGINFIGAAAFVIGLFITVPLTIVATSFVYRKLLKQSLSDQITNQELLQAPVKKEEKEEANSSDTTNIVVSEEVFYNTKPFKENITAHQDNFEQETDKADIKTDNRFSLTCRIKNIINHIILLLKNIKKVRLIKITRSKKDKAETIKVDKLNFEQINKNIKQKTHFLNNIFSKLRFQSFSRQKDLPVPKESSKRVSRVNTFLEKHNLSPQFVISGILVLTSVAIYFALIAPIKSKNEELQNSLKIKAEKLEQYRNKGKRIFNEKTISYKEQEIKLLTNELNECKDILSNKDKMIEKVFTYTNGEEIRDEALWKGYYIKKCNNLITLLNQSKFNTDSREIDFKIWEQKLPSLNEITIEQKRFWIQDEIIKIIRKNRAYITKFHSIKFNDKPQFTNKSLQNLFEPIPFAFELDMDQSKILYLISDILNSELNCVIETVDFKSNEMANYKPGNLINTIYRITINAYVIDFINKV